MYAMELVELRSSKKLWGYFVLGKMGKKGKWLTSVKKAFKSPVGDGEDEAEVETKDLDLFGDIRPLAVAPQEKPKPKVRRWSFGKLALSDDKESEKKKGEVQQKDTSSVTSNSKFTMYMYPSQEEWAAVVIQTAFRGYLARKTLRTLRGRGRMLGLVRSQRVMRQCNKTMRSLQALARVQGRIRAHRVRMSEEAFAVQHRGQPLSRKGSEGLTEGGWNDNQLSAQQMEAKMQEKQVAALKRERAMTYAKTQQMKKASPKAVMPLFIECEVEKPHWGWSYMERWSSTRPWESRIFESNSVLKDVADGNVGKSVDVSATKTAREPSADPKQANGNGRRATIGGTSSQVRTSTEYTSNGHRVNGNGGTGPRSSQATSSSQGGTRDRQSRAGSPKSRCGSDEAEESAPGVARTTTSILTDPQFGPRYSNSGPVKNGVIVDTEVKSPPVVAGHLQATQSVKNKARSASQPRTRPTVGGGGAFKTPATMKRLSYAKSEHGGGHLTKATSDTEGINPRQPGKASRPKSGVLPGPHGSTY